jgi:hypothetical protein
VINETALQKKKVALPVDLQVKNAYQLTKAPITVTGVVE